MACYALCLNASHSALAPIVCYGRFMIFSKGRTIIFLTEGVGVWKILTCKHLSASSCKQFFVRLRLPANTFPLYLHTIYFGVYSLCKQFKSNFSNPPSTSVKKKLTVRNRRSALGSRAGSFLCFFFFFYILQSYRQSVCLF